VLRDVVKCAVIQTYGGSEYQATLDRQLALLETAANSGVRIACLQELSTTPYFCQVQDKAWFKSAEAIPDGPTLQVMSEVARRHSMVLVVPLFEIDARGVFYNSAAVLDADGSYLGKYRKVHIPQNDGFYEKYYFRPGNLGFPVFATKYATVGVYICYDRHFPEGARALGLAGAELVFIPSATGIRSRSQWALEQRCLALANGYFVGTVNRVGKESLGPLEFFGQSYFADPFGEITAQGGGGEEVVTSDVDFGLIPQVRAELPFLRDRRPETYGVVADPLERPEARMATEGGSK
jgi:beta-ureidopropionase